MRNFPRLSRAFALFCVLLPESVARAEDSAETLRHLAVEAATRKIDSAKKEPDAGKRYDSLFDIALELNRLGEVDKARGALLSALEADKRSQARSLRYGRSFFAFMLDKTGAKVEARDVIREAIDAVPFGKNQDELIQNFFKLKYLIESQIDIGDNDGARKSLEKYDRFQDAVDDPGFKLNIRSEKARVLAKLGMFKEAVELARAVDDDQINENNRGMTMLGVAENLPKRFKTEIEDAYDAAQQAILANPNRFLRNQSLISFVQGLAFHDRLDRAIELSDAIDSAADSRFGEGLKLNHANMLNFIAAKLIEREKTVEAIQFARKSLAVCSGTVQESMKIYPLQTVLSLFRDAGDPEGAAEALVALSETGRGADSGAYWNTAEAFRAKGNEKESRKILERCLKRLEKRIADARAGKPAPKAGGDEDIQPIGPTISPAKILTDAIAESAETRFLLGDRAAAFRDLDTLTDIAERDSARRQCAGFRVHADDVSTALELLRAIKDPSLRDDAIIQAALRLKIKKN